MSRVVNKDHARQIARDECERRGWAWVEPAYVRWGLFECIVMSGGRNGKLHIRIRKRDGEILSAGSPAR